jgi:hypothetical protein
MTITFENDSDVIVYALKKVITFARENQYLLLGNCAWWIAGVIGLDSGLTIYIDNLHSRRQNNQREPIPKRNNLEAEVSPTPRDIARGVSSEDKSSKYIPDPLRRTRKGRINPLPQTKRQLKKARQAENRKKALA